MMMRLLRNLRCTAMFSTQDEGDFDCRRHRWHQGAHRSTMRWNDVEEF